MCRIFIIKPPKSLVPKICLDVDSGPTISKVNAEYSSILSRDSLGYELF